ncbi:uncharacterized protein B0H18DRAFT_1024022 [Fomitopsis serialis]|uniref:uncharacterized protein n=1 Tax=Fomitopsis serialis TaxID=139415 RepID=UPI002008E522|nr:uncharacterized protein B0H18DRAFT_1024022 [Neoantrodia serialis]KAH9920452.1 hypothetical protein B0H18DRAFT_1024022 [Neoantrodia serialis]
MTEQQLLVGDSGWPWCGPNNAVVEQPQDPLESDSSQTATDFTFPDMSDLIPALEEYDVGNDERTAPRNHVQESDFAPALDMALPFYGFDFPAEMHVPDAAPVDDHPDIAIREEHIHDCLAQSSSTQQCVNVSSRAPRGAQSVASAYHAMFHSLTGEPRFALRALSPANSPDAGVAPLPAHTCSFGGPECSHILADVTPRGIRKHLEAEHPSQLLFSKGKVQCRWDDCDKWLTGMHNLTKHIAAVHLKSSQVCCPQCGAPCSRRDSLDRHMRRNCHTAQSTAEMHA